MVSKKVGLVHFVFNIKKNGFSLHVKSFVNSCILNEDF